MEEIGLRDRAIRELEYTEKDDEEASEAYDKAIDMLEEKRKPSDILEMLEGHEKQKEALFAERGSVGREMRDREPSENETKLKILKERLLAEEDRKQSKSLFGCCF